MMGLGDLMDYSYLQTLHITAGAVGLISGSVALAASKGDAVHRFAGKVFVTAMLIMAGSVLVLAPFKGAWQSFLEGAVVLYLVSTSFAAITGRDRKVGRIEAVAFLIALSLAVGGFLLASWAAANSNGLDGYRPEVFASFAAIAMFAALMDITVIIRTKLVGVDRIARHLWRMGLALTIAATALFDQRPGFFPETFTEAGFLMVPAILALSATLYWVVRVRLTNLFKD